METEKIISLMQKLSSSSVVRLKYKDESCFLELEKGTQSVNMGNYVVKNDSVTPLSATSNGSGNVYTQTNNANINANNSNKDTSSDNVDCKIVESMLVGTFYASKTEGGKPLVSVGDKVKKGQVIGIIEAMKLMNEVKSPYDGTVLEIMVKNNEVISYSQPIVKIRV